MMHLPQRSKHSAVSFCLLLFFFPLLFLLLVSVSVFLTCFFPVIDRILMSEPPHDATVVVDIPASIGKQSKAPDLNTYTYRLCPLRSSNSLYDHGMICIGIGHGSGERFCHYVVFLPCVVTIYCGIY
jgi:hypothetical protein